MRPVKVNEAIKNEFKLLEEKYKNENLKFLIPNDGSIIIKDARWHTRRLCGTGRHQPIVGQLQGDELGNHQAAAETRPGLDHCCRWPGAGRPAAGDLLLQLLQTSEVSRAGGQTIFQGVFDVGGDDGVEHFSPYLGRSGEG